MLNQNALELRYLRGLTLHRIKLRMWKFSDWVMKKQVLQEASRTNEMNL